VWGRGGGDGIGVSVDVNINVIKIVRMVLISTLDSSLQHLAEF
jgi:hypothetical protein